MKNWDILKFQKLQKEFSTYTWTECVFFLSSLFMAIGFIHFDVREVVFAKFGLELSMLSRFGRVSNQAPKLFITEIYILFLSLLLILNLHKIRKKFEMNNWLRWNNSLLLIFIFMGFGIFRTLVDLQLNPMLGVRNAAFVWYILIPLLVWLLPIRTQVLEKLFWLIQSIALIHLIFSNFGVFFVSPFSVYWFPCLGIIAPTVFALTLSKPNRAYLLLALLSFTIALSYFQGFQRTTLLGGVLGIVGLFFLYPQKIKQYCLRLTFTVACIAFFVLVLQFNKGLMRSLAYDHLTIAGNPLIKSESDNKGIELFRKQLWQDAWGLFLSKPLLGIGFQKQVVYRVSIGSDHYLPNDGDYERQLLHSNTPTAPISGPHNSYLNAISRMGVAGVLILIIHLMHLHALFIQRFWVGFLVLLQGMLYAFFNIGLEGPTRSFFLLLAMGLALKLLTKVDLENE